MLNIDSDNNYVYCAMTGHLALVEVDFESLLINDRWDWTYSENENKTKKKKIIWKMNGKIILYTNLPKHL